MITGNVPLLGRKHINHNYDVKCNHLAMYHFLGRYDLHWFGLLCDECGIIQSPMSMKNILRNGFWPGSPCNINYLFDQEVFRVWEAFRMRMPGSSESAFIKALEDISLLRGRVIFIILVFVLVCGKHYINIRYSMSLQIKSFAIIMIYMMFPQTRHRFSVGAHPPPQKLFAPPPQGHLAPPPKVFAPRKLYIC